MLKNYKPYGELDLTEYGYLFELTDVEFGTVLTSLASGSKNYVLTNGETDLGNDLVHSTLDLTKLKEQIECGKYTKITVMFNINDNVVDITLNKSGSVYTITSGIAGIIVTFEINTGSEYVHVVLTGANLVLE